MATLDVSRFDYFAPADNIGPYPGQWAGGISFANSGSTGWQICGASLGSIPDFSVRIKASDTAFSGWYKLYHTGFKPTSSDISGLGTAATKNVGTGSGQIPDMTSFSSGSGWQRLPGGVIIQWGNAISGRTGDAQINPFPIAFTDLGSIQIVATYDNPDAPNGPVYFGAKANTTSSFRLLNSLNNANVAYARWIAIGR